jgi:crotonobetainyl-CoA:carnitine CoA-transferase CaiB-like acyl-CoA transferase
MPGPLEGILVIALEQAVAAPYVTCRLADAGARIIKLERPEGDFARGYDRFAKGSSSYFVWLNRGKQSCRVDLRQPDDLALVRRMLAGADIFIQNLAPGAAERLGIGSEALRQAHPRLITCDISGYGSTGPMQTRKAYDLLVQAESGLASITGGPGEPARVGVSVCDIATGMHAYEAMLEALIQRGRTGVGTGVKVSLFHSLMDWMNVPWIAHASRRRCRRRCRCRSDCRTAPSRTPGCSRRARRRYRCWCCCLRPHRRRLRSSGRRCRTRQPRRSS